MSLVCSIMPHMLTSISYTIPPSMLMASHIVNGIIPHTTQYVSHGRAQWYLFCPDPAIWLRAGIMGFVVWFAAATQPFGVFLML